LRTTIKPIRLSGPLKPGFLRFDNPTPDDGDTINGTSDDTRLIPVPIEEGWLLITRAVSFAEPAVPLEAATVPTNTVSLIAIVHPVGSNADQALHADIARSTYQVDGTGITIGILSDSFNLKGQYTTDVADGALPAGMTILKEGSSGSDEGRAMAELIHKIAPGAQIVFYTATSSEADFAAGILALQAAGCQIIVDDVTYFDEPFYQDGSVVQSAVETVIASGVSYFTSAGNAASNYYEGTFTPILTTLPKLSGEWLAQNFGTTASPTPYESLTIPAYATIVLDLQWDQPFASIGDSAGSANSLALALYNSSGQLVASASVNDVGKDPVQVLQFTNASTSTSFSLVVYSNGSTILPGLFKVIMYGAGKFNDASAGTGSGTLIGHEMVPAVNSVGAVAWSQTPRFGGSDTVESFSSAGGGVFLFDAEGNRLAVPETAGGVDFVAPDGNATDVFNPFYGTSAAAPEAAAVAALMLQADPSLTPGQITAILTSSTVAAYGATGTTGAGLIQADAAVRKALAMASLTAGTTLRQLPEGAGPLTARAAAPALTAAATDPTMLADFTGAIGNIAADWLPPGTSGSIETTGLWTDPASTVTPELLAADVTHTSLLT
jgi:hypothetical protein